MVAVGGDPLREVGSLDIGRNRRIYLREPNLRRPLITKTWSGRFWILRPVGDTGMGAKDRSAPCSMKARIRDASRTCESFGSRSTLAMAAQEGWPPRDHPRSASPPDLRSEESSGMSCFWTKLSMKVMISVPRAWQKSSFCSFVPVWTTAISSPENGVEPP